MPSRSGTVVFNSTDYMADLEVCGRTLGRGVSRLRISYLWSLQFFCLFFKVSFRGVSKLTYLLNKDKCRSIYVIFSDTFVFSSYYSVS